jgi:SAM-dependent methyltransferase
MIIVCSRYGRAMGGRVGAVPTRLTPRRIAAGLFWRGRALRNRVVPSPPPGTSFREGVLARFGVSAEAESPNPTVGMWLEFALSSLERGRQAVWRMGGTGAFFRRRVLDVGCAYGGFLVAAREAGARHVVGVDVDAGLIELARRQLADHRVAGELLVADVMDPALVDRIGRFDLVMCNDVIEHVVDPEACAGRLAALVAPGGRLYLEIPNGWAVDFMLSDGHYGLFGITLLGRAGAEEWWRRSYAEEVYGVEHYAPLAFYLEAFSRHGVSLRLIHAPLDPEGVVERLEPRFDRLADEIERRRADHPGDPLFSEVERHALHEIARFRHLAERYRASSVAAERRIIAITLALTYELTFFTLEGTASAHQ